ncbi:MULTISPECIES: nuclease-related domain-containing protein [unclassified Leifsonia]|uniref:nuclease-related domain-containing protein n=1 Tax=unclassified Leifsonia TaxID=2663824 RepID=UPI0009D9FFCD|nr:MULTISPECIES: nuclease-related domain-containing protein [unclassified Leifsonia]TDP99013.1 nuclease-like protein [Leifsonia sp. 115AMFTsu3.1]
MGDESTASAPEAVSHVDFAGISALSSRPAGYAVALKCLQIQAEAEGRDPGLRTDKRVTLHPDAWSWYQGALGEMRVGEMLSDLGTDWFVRHSVPIGADTKDVDHLVIGPSGVYAINTKHHHGASVWVGDHVLRVNNANTTHLKVARSDALDVGRRLAEKVGFPVPVTPVIAVLNARSVKDGRSAQNQSIAVVDADQLVAWLKARPSQLSTTKVELLRLAAEEPQTWHVDPRAADTLRVMQRFERLVSRVSNPIAESSRGRPLESRKPIGPATRRAPQARRRRASRSQLVRLWAGAAIAVTAILIIRGMANAPCTTPTGCILPAIYLAWKPLLIVGGVVAIARAMFGTFRAMRH